MLKNTYKSQVSDLVDCFSWKKKKFKMEEVLLRFCHIGKQIFEELDNGSLTKCREVNESWRGFIDVENEIHKYDILISLSEHEGFSRILLESSFVGLYVISLENSGTKFISELENSKLIANLNINSFKEVLENLQEIELSLSSKNRDLIERNYSSSEIAKRFNNIYKSI